MSNEYLFVYGTLKKGYGNNYHLKNSKYIKTLTIKSKYKLVDLGPFPALVPFENELFDVVGELYEVTKEDFLSCDYLEGYPNFYDRSKIEQDGYSFWVYHFKPSTSSEFKHRKNIRLWERYRAVID